MMMLYIAVKKRVAADSKCQCYHSPFKNNIMDNIYTKQGKAAH